MRTTRAEVDLSAIQHNIKQISGRVGHDVRILGVVKANAYGHGLVEASKTMIEAGASYVGVAITDEAIQLRHHVNVPILVFSPPVEDSFEPYLRFDLDATVGSLETAYALNSAARTAGKKARVQIKVDTGMGRIGFFPRDALEAVKAVLNLDSLSLVGIYSHFATSDEFNKDFARRQLSAFRNVVAGVKELDSVRNRSEQILFHIASSGAILDMPDTYFDMVRPGIMSYGYYPSVETSESLNLKPAMSLKSTIIQIKNFHAGMSVSYGRKYFTGHDTRIAVVPIGYGDGYTRLLTGKASVLIKGRKYPVVGTITMDHLMVDIRNDFEIQSTDDVVLIGKSGDISISAWDVASSLGTIPYEILCMINSRVPRVYCNSKSSPLNPVYGTAGILNITD
ncbi:MAG: alanine racemase [Candidatus Kryptoniota bacterium]